MDAPHVVIADMKAFPGKAQRLRLIEEQLVRESLKEKGCLRYELNQAIDDDHRFFIIEAWESESDWRAHASGAAFLGFKASGGSDLIEHLEISHLALIASQP